MGRMTAPPATILVVDDEPMILDSTRIILERGGGYNVIAASDGQEALGLCRDRKDPIHLLLSDINMPGINGPQLARGVAELFPDVRVMFMSGYDFNTPDMQALVSEGRVKAPRFLPKPFTYEELLNEVKTILAT
jgi:two-component system cell cycle sensor histidine kinase/response regulator CckA